MDNYVTIIKPSQFNRDKTRIKCYVCKEELPLNEFDDFEILKADQKELKIEYETLGGVSLFPIAEQLIVSSAVCKKKSCDMESKRASVELALGYPSMLEWDRIVELNKELKENKEEKLKKTFKKSSETVQLDHLPEKPGIYLIFFFPKGYFYIGKSINVLKRAQDHLNSLRKGCHENTRLQECFNEYGESAFAFFLLETCSPKKLSEREYYWLKRARVHETHLSFNKSLINKLLYESKADDKSAS